EPFSACGLAGGLSRKRRITRSPGGKIMRQPTRMFWQGKPVCITGGSGFLGYQLVRQLLDLGADVRVHTLPPREHHPISDLPIKITHGDIRDADSVRRTVEGCAIIFHTAGVV